jgi:hypothetical protein
MTDKLDFLNKNLLLKSGGLLIQKNLDKRKKKIIDIGHSNQLLDRPFRLVKNNKLKN